MSRKKKSVLAAAARAREGKQAKKLARASEVIEISSNSGMDLEVCSWDGGVNHEVTSDSEFCLTDSDDESEAEEFSDLDGEELVQSIEEEMKKMGLPKPLAIIMQSVGKTAVWKKAEQNRAMGYNGLSTRTQQFHAQKARRKEAEDAILRKRCVTECSQCLIRKTYISFRSNGASMMRSFVKDQTARRQRCQL